LDVGVGDAPTERDTFVYINELVLFLLPSRLYREIGLREPDFRLGRVAVHSDEVSRISAEIPISPHPLRTTSDADHLVDRDKMVIWVHPCTLTRQSRFLDNFLEMPPICIARIA
jgi:hypothetical protein